MPGPWLSEERPDPRHRQMSNAFMSGILTGSHGFYNEKVLEINV